MHKVPRQPPNKATQKKKNKSFLFNFLIFLISIPKKKKFLFVSALYLMVKLLDSFKGARAIFLTQLLFVMWYYAKVYGIKIKPKTMVKLTAFTVIFSQFLVSFRSKKIFSFDLIIQSATFYFPQE